MSEVINFIYNSFLCEMNSEYTEYIIVSGKLLLKLKLLRYLII